MLLAEPTPQAVSPPAEDPADHGLPVLIPGAEQQHTARCRMCLPLFRAVSLCCGCDHPHVCMRTQTEIKSEFSEFFDKMIENNGACCQLPSCSIGNRSQTCRL